MDLVGLLVRGVLATQYAGLTTAGTLMLLSPSVLLQSTMGAIIYTWAAFLVLGGTLCLVGTLTRLWIGEFTGLTLLMTANLVWSVALIRAGDTSAKYGIVLLAWMFGLLYREIVIFDKARKAAHAGRDRRDGHG